MYWLTKNTTSRLLSGIPVSLLLMWFSTLIWEEKRPYKMYKQTVAKHRMSSGLLCTLECCWHICSWIYSRNMFTCRKEKGAKLSVVIKIFCIYKSRWKLTLGARDFSSAVSGFCQVFIVTRAKIKPLFFFTKFCDILSFHYPGYQRFFSRFFPPHARKTSGTQGSGS